MAQDDKTETQSEDPKDLRSKLNAALETNKQLQSRLDDFDRRDKLTEGGLGHLSTRQRRAILRDLNDDKTEFSVEAALEVAKDYGWDKPPEKKEDPSQGGQEQSQTDTPDPRLQNSLNGFEQIQAQQGAAQNGNLAPDLETEMKSAKSREELREVIRKKGAPAGLMHSWDS